MDATREPLKFTRADGYTRDISLEREHDERTFAEVRRINLNRITKRANERFCAASAAVEEKKKSLCLEAIVEKSNISVIN